MYDILIKFNFRNAVATGLFLIFLMSGLTVNAQTDPVFISSCSRQYVEEADHLRKNKKFDTAINTLKNGLEACPNDPGLYWRIALNNLEWGDNQYNDGKKPDKKSRLINFERALYWAKEAVKADSLNRVTHAPEMVSTAYAAIISISGIKKKANLADSVRIYAEKAIAIDRENDRAYHILGRWYYEVSRLGWLSRFLADVFLGTSPEGTIEEAVFYFKRAIQAKESVVHHYWLGMAYLRKGDKEEALEQFEELMDLPNERHNDAYFKTQAQKVIENNS